VRTKKEHQTTEERTVESNKRTFTLQAMHMINHVSNCKGNHA